jgi:hypothetical protein
VTRLPDHHPAVWLPSLAIAGAALALAASGHTAAAVLVSIALVVGAGLLLEVDLPWGGQVPLGYAILIAVAVLVTPPATAVVAVLALVAAGAVRRRGLDVVVTAGGSVAAALAELVFESAVDTAASDVGILVEVVVVGSAFLAVDLVAGRRRLDQVAPLYITLLCAAALLAVAYEQRAALSLVAAVPLLVTKYSFGRFSQARETYAQTTRALSLLPEVAGLTPLGHGERTAVYATALAEELGFDAPSVDRIATAARLHHIGHISLHEPEERHGPVDGAELGRVSAELLRETGFLAGVADLVEEVQDGRVGATSLEGAVIRVCSTLDDLAEVELRDDPFALALVHHRTGPERTAAIALLGLHDHRPGLLEEGRAASRVLAQVASAAGSAGHDDHDDHDQVGHDCR